jgi:hypothetical protein
MNVPHRVWTIAGLALLASACSAAQARQPIERPALEVPPVPPRLIEPMPQPPEKPPAPDPVPEANTAPAASTRKQAQQPRETNKPDPKPEAQAPTDLPAAPPPTPAVPPLRTPNTAPDNAEASRQVREAVDRAKRSLDSVDYRLLTREQQELYNQAKLFLQQSEDKLKTSDFELARNYADRAEQIAKQLQKR